MHIAAVINYCTNDYRFLARAIDEVRPFASQIIVPVSDHFFDGSSENFPLLERTFADHRDVLFLVFAYDVKRLYTPYVQRVPDDEDWGALWHSTSRYLAFLYLADSINAVLFLDADEILEGKRFGAWLQSESRSPWDAFWFSAYTYRFQAAHRTDALQQTALLVRRSALSPLKIFSAQERFGLFAGLAGPKRLQVVGLDDLPMIHHYSWVRPHTECLKKASTWGKRHHRDWAAWLQCANSEEPYTEVSPYFDPLTVSMPTQFPQPQNWPHVMRVDPATAFKRELDAIH